MQTGTPRVSFRCRLATWTVLGVLALHSAQPLLCGLACIVLGSDPGNAPASHTSCHGDAVTSAEHRITAQAPCHDAPAILLSAVEARAAAEAPPALLASEWASPFIFDGRPLHTPPDDAHALIRRSHRTTVLRI